MNVNVEKIELVVSVEKMKLGSRESGKDLEEKQSEGEINLQTPRG